MTSGTWAAQYSSLLSLIGGLLLTRPLAYIAKAALLMRLHEWVQCGPLLRARMAAANRSPDSEVLALLTEAGKMDGGLRLLEDGWRARRYQIESGKRHTLDDNEPEWGELLAQMAPSGQGTAADRVVWQALPTLMRSAGDNALSPWVKFTHTEGRSYYKRDDPLETTLVPPAEGVRQEAEIGMPGLLLSAH